MTTDTVAAMVRIVPAIIDLVLVVIFATIGRASHSEGLTAVGIADTAWPFLLACLAGWVVVNLLNDSGHGPRAALVVWAVTVLGGMGLRIVSGETAEVAFVVVATLTLFTFFFGWRLATHIVVSRRQKAA